MYDSIAAFIIALFLCLYIDHTINYDKCTHFWLILASSFSLLWRSARIPLDEFEASTIKNALKDISLDWKHALFTQFFVYEKET